MPYNLLRREPVSRTVQSGTFAVCLNNSNMNAGSVKEDHETYTGEN